MPGPYQLRNKILQWPIHRKNSPVQNVFCAKVITVVICNEIRNASHQLCVLFHFQPQNLPVPICTITYRTTLYISELYLNQLHDIKLILLTNRFAILPLSEFYIYFVAFHRFCSKICLQSLSNKSGSYLRIIDVTGT